MTRTVRAEWERLCRTRTALTVFLPLVILPALITVFTFAAGTGNPGPGPASHITVTRADLTGSNGYLAGIDSASTVIGVIVMVFVAVSLGADYSHATLRNLLVRQPRRNALMTGKLLAVVAFTMAGGALSVAAAIGTAWIVAPIYDVSTSAWTSVLPEGLATLGVLAVSAIGWAAAGAALVAVLKSTPSAVAAGVVWALPVEASLTAVWEGGDRWLPGAVFSSVANRGTDALGLSTAIALTAVYAAITYAGATRVFGSQDVVV